MSSHQARRLRSRLGWRFLRRLGWLVGAPLAIFRFFRRQVPIEEIDPAGTPDPLASAHPDFAQGQEEQAVGPMVHRLYSATIQAPILSAERLLGVIAADPNVIAPSEVLRFEKTRGERGDLQEGDELLVRMVGPWNGPVEVTRRWEQGFRLAARRGHPQLGDLELRARDDDGQLAVEIETRERAAGRGFHVLERVGLIRRMQTYVWAEMLENAARLTGGRRLNRITLQSWRGRQRGFRPAPPTSGT